MKGNPLKTLTLSVESDFTDVTKARENICVRVYKAIWTINKAQ